MSVPWLKHFVGARVSAPDLLRIPNPRLELTLHVTFKTVQAGAFLGSFVIAPITQAIKGPHELEDFKRAAIDAGYTGALVGLVAGPLMTLLRCSNLNTLQVYDRCYRIRFSTRQTNLDRFTAVGAIVGAGVAGAPGAAVGVNGGLIAGNLFNILF